MTGHDAGSVADRPFDGPTVLGTSTQHQLQITVEMQQGDDTVIFTCTVRAVADAPLQDLRRESMDAYVCCKSSESSRSLTREVYYCGGGLCMTA